ncbi:MAG: hypothetical protein PUP93_03545 [Rhizonema sp. NSF051]|nr:hypothetical protein [Rhizonema sp. NSF051]
MIQGQFVQLYPNRVPHGRFDSINKSNGQSNKLSEKGLTSDTCHAKFLDPSGDARSDAPDARSDARSSLPLR